MKKAAAENRMWVLFSTNISYTNSLLGLKIKKHRSFNKPYEALNNDLGAQEAFLMHSFLSSYVPFLIGQSRCAAAGCKPVKYFRTLAAA